MNKHAPGKLERIADERGMPLEALIRSAIEEGGSVFQAAISLDVAPNSIQNWMKRNGYRLEIEQKTRLVKE